MQRAPWQYSANADRTPNRTTRSAEAGFCRERRNRKRLNPTNERETSRRILTGQRTSRRQADVGILEASPYERKSVPGRARSAIRHRRGVLPFSNRLQETADFLEDGQARDPDAEHGSVRRRRHRRIPVKARRRAEAKRRPGTPILITANVFVVGEHHRLRDAAVNAIYDKLKSEGPVKWSILHFAGDDAAALDKARGAE